MRRKLFRLGAPSMALLAFGCSPDPQTGSEQQAMGTTLVTTGPLQVPSCYDIAGIAEHKTLPKRMVFVLVDQTTAFPENVRANIGTGLAKLIAKGGAIEIDTFSAFTRDHHASRGEPIVIELTVPESKRQSINVRALEKLDRCLQQQKPFAMQEARRRLAASMAEPADQFASSEILGGLTELSKATKQSSVSEKSVIVASDLLEHSTVTSFYQSKQIRQIDPQAELEKAAKAGQLADFGGASVYVVGAGLLPPDSASNATRNAAALEKLKMFWRSWFASSNAELVELGQPEMMTLQ